MVVSSNSKKVCVVGAGVAGLSAARELLQEGHGVTVMEQSAGVGGQWLYDPATDAGGPLGTAGAHSSIYASLRLNTPREVVGFSGFPFYPKDNGGGDARRYPGHGEFLRYIRDFCDAFGFMDAVRLNTRVLHVGPAPRDGGIVLRWVVRCVKQGDCGEVVTTTEEVFDAVVVAVGQYTQPRLPTINLHLHPEIDCLCEDGRVVFSDGFVVVADAIIYCSGYNYSFPFLDTAGHVTVDDNRVGPLFEHTFPPALAPSLSFVGVPKRVVLPRFYEMQARWVAQVLSGRRALPPEEEMLRAAEEYNRAREAAGVPKRLTHDVNFDLELCDEFVEKRCGFPRLEDWKKELVSSAIRSLRDDPESFRDDYLDSDIVLEGLRSQGWLTGRAPAA